MVRLVVVSLVVSALAVPVAFASPQSSNATTASARTPETGVPIPPATIVRGEDGTVTVRAVRLDAPIVVDGQLDEAVYRTIEPASGFIQSEPNPGAPARDQTDVWVMFDGQNLYMAARCWDLDNRIVATEMRRDNRSIFQGNDYVAFSLDTFHDRRNSFAFIVNAIGGRMDGQTANENQYNGDWNPIWDTKVGRFEGGWTVEVVVPFRSIRYGAGTDQTWGFSVLRPSRSINEISFLTEMPPARAAGALQLASRFATLVGLELPPSSRPLEIKPYLTSSATRDVPQDVSDLAGDVGVDLKYGLTQGMTADVTVNTDFAQVEADEQQVNLTRFSLFFPEKRDFFLENAGIFSFGGVSVSGNNAGQGLTPILFYSRRIGLDGGSVVPLRAGGRVTGRAGPFSVGVLDIQTGDVPDAGARSTNFSVVRLKRDILRRSAIGVLATGRSVDQNGGRGNYLYGVDGTFGFFTNLSVNTYWARTNTSGRSDDDVSYLTQMNYNADRYGVVLERLAVGSNFNPEVGLVRRDDMRRTFGELRFSPRPRAIRGVRKVSWTGSINYIENRDGVLETREQVGSFGIDFSNSDVFTTTYTRSYEFLDRPFPISSNVTLPVGGYAFDDVAVSYEIAQSRPVRATLSASRGSFYSGHKTTLQAQGGRVRISNQFSTEPSYTFNDVDLAEGRFTTHLLGLRATYTMTPAMFASVLVQYNSSTESASTNARFRWEYQPGSELFIVYNETRDTLTPRFPELVNRAVIVKVNRLFRF